MDNQLGSSDAITAVEQLTETLVGLWRETREQTTPSVSEQQLRVLSALEKADIHLSALAERLALPPSSATRLCDRLERLDLIRRRPLGRRVIICLTPSGRRLVANVRHCRLRRLEQAWGRIPAADQTLLTRVLVHLHRGIGTAPVAETALPPR